MKHHIPITPRNEKPSTEWPHVEIPGKTVGGLDIRKRYNINILAVKNEEEFSIAISPETYFAENDKLLVLGEYRALQKCFRI